MGVEAADAVIQRVFRVGLNLAASAAMLKGAAADRLLAAIADLDTVIVELRNAAFAQQPQSLERTVETTSRHAPTVTDGIIKQLALLAYRVCDLTEPADGPAYIHHHDAAHSLHHALITLAVEPSPGAAPPPPGTRRRTSDRQPSDVGRDAS